MRMMQLLLCMILFFASAGARAESWIYHDIREPRNQLILEASPPRSVWMDVAGSADFCGGKTKFWCFAAGDLRFAVPKGFSGKQQEWTYDGTLYKLAGVSRRHILGRQYLTYFIEADLSPYKMRFHYTREAGLIAISTVGESQGMLLILSEKCGYAASSKCGKSR